MPTSESTFTSTYGSGYIRFEDGSSTLTGYKLVLDIADLTGGGFLFGLSQDDSIRIAELTSVFLSIAPSEYLALVPGRYDGDWLPVVSLGVIANSSLPDAIIGPQDSH